MSEYIEPGAGDSPGPDELPDGAWLARLQALIRESAAGAPSATEFAERMRVQGARLIAQTSRSGRVSGVSYEYEGHVVKGSVLGPAYTWSGLQKKLGVTYVRQRDQAAMEGRLELSSSQDFPTPEEIARQAPLPLDTGELGAHTFADDEYSESSDSNNPGGFTEPGDSAKASETGEPGEFDEPVRHATEPEDAPILVPTAQPVGSDPRPVDAEPWEEWAAELEHETPEVDREPGKSVLVEEREPQGASSDTVPPEESITALGAVTVETEQWQALVSAVGELRDQVRAWDTRLADVVAERSPSGDEEIREQMAALTGIVRQASHAAQQAAEAMNRAKQESLWLSVTSASIAGLIAALLVGLWFSQSAADRVDEMQQAVIEHMEKQAAEDPLRQYFDRIVKKLQQP